MSDEDPLRPVRASGAVPRRRSLISIALICTLVVVAMIAVYFGSFYLLYYSALQKNAMDGLFYIEQGNYRNCSLITHFYPEDKDVWPFTTTRFFDVYHPLIWWHMKQGRKTTDSSGQPFDLSRTRQHCIERGVDPRLFDGELLITVMRNGPVLVKADYFWFRIVADLAQ